MGKSHCLLNICVMKSLTRGQWVGWTALVEGEWENEAAFVEKGWVNVAAFVEKGVGRMETTGGLVEGITS